MNYSPSELIAISKTYGSPIYIYDGDLIVTQYHKLTNAFAAHPVKFFYACKALSNINILKLIHSLGCNLDCVSINEIRLGLLAGFSPSQIIFTPNCVAFSEIEQAKNLKVNINIDSISMLEQFGNKFNHHYPIGIRINPHIMAGGNYKISTGHVDSKFGISINQLRHVERIIKSTGLIIKLLHVHTGSEIKDIAVFIEILKKMLELSSHFPDLQYLDLGGGFKVAYDECDSEIDLNLLAQQLIALLQDFNQKYNKNLNLCFEPGKFLVSTAGVLLVTANLIKPTSVTTFVGINSGFNHLIRPMFYGAYHRISNLSNQNSKERIYTVVGNLCETDTFAVDRKIKEIHEGDILLIHNAGAYGFEMSSNFNSRLRPAEVLLYQGKVLLIRAAEEFADLLYKQL